MIRLLTFVVASALASAPAFAQAPWSAPPSPSIGTVLAPPEIVAAAPAGDWVPIAPSDLLVMDLAPDRNGRSRRVVIQLMPAPFSQGWVSNIRKLAAAHWYDGNAIVRVHDNYVVQWGDPASEDESADGRTPQAAKALPSGLASVPQSNYEVPFPADKQSAFKVFTPMVGRKLDAEQASNAAIVKYGAIGRIPVDAFAVSQDRVDRGDPYTHRTGFLAGWPVGFGAASLWPVHCYGSVGVGRNVPPDTGSGAELYAVIGQAPRHLDRNIAVVGRVIEGIEVLSSLPRGTGPLGFYEHAEERVPILSIRMGDAVPGLPRFQYLATTSGTFKRYEDARANRRDAFFIQPAGGVDVCNVPVPVRRVPR
jgi:peptidylprolyl isomerase